MSKIQINNILSIESNPSNTLLETMENSGMEVEYQCRDGHCGACKCKLISGEVEYVGFAMAYTQDNEVLPCICRAKNNIELDSVHYRQKSKRA